MAAHKHDADTIKTAARGRWPEIISRFGGVPIEILDGKHHPCPKCMDGTDRFSFAWPDRGGCLCRKCFDNKNGDGISALQWLTGKNFSEVATELEDYLGIKPTSNGKPHKKTKGPLPIFATAAGVSRYYRNLLAETHKGKVQCVQHWDYGAFQILRFNLPTPEGEKQRKEFRPVHKVPLGKEGALGWQGGYPKGLRPLYHLADVEAADPAIMTVHAGEKATDAAIALGLPATTNAGGEMAIRNTNWKPLTRFETILINIDADDAGEAFGYKLAETLKKQRPDQTVKIVRLPNLPKKGDVVEWVANGGTPARFMEIAEEAPPVTADDAQAWKKQRKAEPFNPSRIPLTDTGNAERFAFLNSGQVHYSYVWGKWFEWDGRRWNLDSSGGIERRGKATIRSILNDAEECTDPEKADAIKKFARNCESADRRRAMLSLAKCEGDIPVNPTEFDANPWLLNCLNGTLDLLTGELRAHKPTDMISKLCPVEYDPDATCEAWEKFQHEICMGRQSLVDCKRVMFGYCLTGSTEEQILPILYGKGKNGKGTEANVLLEMLGADYAMKAPTDFLMSKKSEAHPTDKADLFGKRLVICNETNEGKRLDEALVKELTGSDRIRARRMREDFWEFAPTHKILLACNHKPTIKGTDVGIWRRLREVPYELVVATADMELPEKLRAELPGILAWCVRGCLEWRAAGTIVMPTEIQEATIAYRMEQDVLGNFIETYCDVGPGLSVRARNMYLAYKRYCDETGEYPVSLVRFGKSITERGYEKESGRTVTYLGIGLLEAEREQQKEQERFY